MSTLSWQAGNASGSFLTGTIIQALITLNHDSYEAKPYQGTLLVFAMVAILYIVNIWGAQIWPKIQNGLMILHILGFLVVIIVLWACAPHQSAKAVFTEFTNAGGWSSMGLSVMVGQITAIYALLGESKTHARYEILLTDENQDPMRPLTLRKKSEMPVDTYLSLSFGVTLGTESWQSFS
jgi:amino acid transporter